MKYANNNRCILRIINIGRKCNYVWSQFRSELIYLHFPLICVHEICQLCIILANIVQYAFEKNFLNLLYPKGNPITTQKYLGK